jgi:hypothetical protein
VLFPLLLPSGVDESMLCTGPLKYDKIRAFLEPFALKGKRNGEAKKKVPHEEL